MSPSQRALLRLGRSLGDSTVRTDPSSCETYARDESEAEPVTPAGVVHASTAEHVRQTLAVCHDEGVCVVPRGGATGRTGGATVIRPDTVVLDTTPLAAVKHLDRANQTVVVEPGVRTAALHALAESEGMFFPPDPLSAEWSCLGGNVAENAGGPRAFKYGVTREYTRVIEAALMGGETVRAGHRTSKGVAGYDVASLLVGSEGTLAVFTELTLRLVALPPEVRTLVAGFADARDAGRAVASLVARGLTPRCVELVDEVCSDVMRAHDATVLPAGARAVLVIECDGHHPAAVDAELDRVADVCDSVGARHLERARTRDEREALWRVRRVMSRSLRATAAHKLSEDVVVPRSEVPALLDAVRVIAARESIVMPTYGHAGDGNLHVNVLWNTPDERPRVDRAIEALFRATLDLGGTLSGEHGIGVLKAPYLPWEQSPALLDLQQRIKAAFDPRGLLNPGKVFTPGGAPSHRGC